MQGHGLQLTADWSKRWAQTETAFLWKLRIRGAEGSAALPRLLGAADRHWFTSKHCPGKPSGSCSPESFAVPLAAPASCPSENHHAQISLQTSDQGPVFHQGRVCPPTNLGEESKVDTVAKEGKAVSLVGKGCPHTSQSLRTNATLVHFLLQKAQPSQNGPPCMGNLEARESKGIHQLQKKVNFLLCGWAA